MRFRQLHIRYTEISRGPGALGDLLAARWPATLAEREWRPRTDLYETGDAWTVQVELAGVNEDDFEILLYEDTLLVRGSRRGVIPPSEVRFHVAEIRYGPFQLEMPLPFHSRTEEATARYDRGFLFVTLPKGATA